MRVSGRPSYLCGAARTFRLHNYTHGSHLTFRMINDLGSLCLKTKETAQ